MIFSADPDDPTEAEKVDVVVIEIKPRTPHDKNLYVVQQLHRRAEKLVDHCPKIQRVWYFGIIEIDEDIVRSLKGQRWAPLFSRGTILYKELDVLHGDIRVPVPFFLLSYDAIIKDAAARNHTFLEILKEEIRKAKK